MEDAAKQNGINAHVLKAQLRQESGYNPKIVSYAGAIGIAQIMPGTARHWNVNPWDPKASIYVAAKNMSSYYNTYLRQGKSKKEAYSLALAAYNAGPGAVQRHGTRIILGKTHVRDYDGQTYHYVRSIIRAAVASQNRSQDDNNKG